MLGVLGSICAAGEEKFRCPNMHSLVSFAGMTLNKCAVLRIGKLNGDPLCREGYPLCRLKNPTVVYMITCRLSSYKTGVYNVHLLIILERECSQLTSLRCYNVVLTLQYGHENVVNNVVSLFSKKVFFMCTQRCQTTFHITFSQPSCNIF